MACCIRADVASEIHVSARAALVVARGDLPTGFAETLADAPRVAWDVETTGLDWHHDRLATCQLYGEGIGVVVVSLSNGRPARLAALLENPSVEKVFHHAPFDLRFMVHAWGVRPASIRCTKVASKLLEPNAPNEAHSLQQLALHHLGIRLDKGPVRTSDWSAAELTQGQLEYAAGDVLHLPALLDVLTGALKSVGLTQLYDECCAFLPARAFLEIGGYPDVFAY
jgi:ribonuclease D